MRETGKRREEAGCAGNYRDKKINSNERHAIPWGKGFRFSAREIAF